MKLVRLDETKKLFPHWYDKHEDSNFTKHLSIINNQQLDLYHKLKCLDWSRILEKPIQIWKEQDAPYTYTMHFKVLIPNLKEVNVYKNPIIQDNEIVNAKESRILHEPYDNDLSSFYEATYTDTLTAINNKKELINSLNFLMSSEYTDIILYEDELPPLNLDNEEITIIRKLLKQLQVLHKNGKYELYQIKKTNNVYTYDRLTKNLNEYLKKTIVNRKLDEEVRLKRFIIPRDTFVVEVKTYDDYHWLKGFPENDYVRYDTNTVYGSTLQYRDSESFLDINIEEISYNKYLVFRIHQDNINKITIKKNGETIFYEDFLIDVTTNKQFQNNTHSYQFYDKDYVTQLTFQQDDDSIYEVEDANGYYLSTVHKEQDEYIYRLLLKDTDFKDNDYTSNILIDEYDLEVSVYEKRYKCTHDKEIVYHKRYNGYDNVSGDCFDHDYSLDMIGNMFNVPRLQFYPVLQKNATYYSKTYPSYNNRVSEDDYHYMKRIQYYISNYNHIYFPVLEFWKYYYTDSTLVNRKVKVARQGYAYLRTRQDDICTILPEDLTEEEFSDTDVETTTEYSNIAVNTTTSSSKSNDDGTVYYSINKATYIKGEGIVEKRAVEKTIDDDGEETVKPLYWAESVIINKLYIVPNSNYRLRYGVTDNNNPVDVLIHCYTYDGQLIRSTEFVATEETSKLDGYNNEDNYDYYTLSLNMPSDTSYIEIMLQSDTGFKYQDVTFERETIAVIENLYMSNLDGYYNSCTYDLYANYYDIPTNLRIGDTERFNSLFNRSLPLTKQGVFNLNILEESDTNINITEKQEYGLIDLFYNSEYKSGTGHHFEIDAMDYIKGGCRYKMSVHILRDEHFDYETDPLEDFLEPTDDFLVTIRILWFDDKNIDVDDDVWMEEHFINELILEKRPDNDIEGLISHTFKAPKSSNCCRIILTTEEDEFTYWDLRLCREEFLTEEELVGE